MRPRLQALEIRASASFRGTPFYRQRGEKLRLEKTTVISPRAQWHGLGNGRRGDHVTGGQAGEAAQGVRVGLGCSRPGHQFHPVSDETPTEGLKKGTETRELCFGRLPGTCKILYLCPKNWQGNPIRPSHFSEGGFTSGPYLHSVN